MSRELLAAIAPELPVSHEELVRFLAAVPELHEDPHAARCGRLDLALRDPEELR